MKRKKKAAGAAEEEELEEGGSSGGGKKKLFLMLGGVVIIAAAVFCVISFLRGGEKDDTIDPPETYLLGGEEVPAPQPTGEELVVHKTENEDTGAVTYTYEGVAEPARLTTDYIAQLTGADLDFTVVDDTLTEIKEPPTFEGTDGAVRMARDGKEDMAQSISISWNSESYTVVVEELEGEVTFAPEPVTLTLTEAVEYISVMAPASLELEEDTMDAYRIYTRDGVVLVDGQPCIELKVYKNEKPVNTNVIMGRYFLSADGLNLYKLDEDAGTVKRLPDWSVPN